MVRLSPLQSRRCLANGISDIPEEVRFLERVVRRPPPEFVDDYPESRMADRFREATVSITLGEPTCLRVRDARVIGFRYVVTRDNCLVSDHSPPAETLLSAVAKHQGTSFEDTDFSVKNGRLRSKRIKKVDAEIEQPIVFLTSAEPSNYGSFIFRVLPKLTALRQFGLEEVPLFIYSPRWQRDLLALAGTRPASVIHHDTCSVYQVSELYLPSLRNPQAYLDPESVAFYRQLVTDLGIVQQPNRLIYVSRQVAVANRPDIRPFLNELEFIAELELLGFEIIEPERLPVIEQVRRFAGAKVILGPSGSGMFNTVFAPRDAMFISVEAFPYWLHAHANLPASLGQRYAFLIGEPDLDDSTPVHKRWRLDVPKAIERIKRVVEGLN